MTRGRCLAAAGLAVVLLTGVLAGCGRDSTTDPGADPTASASDEPVSPDVDPSETPEPSTEPTAEPAVNGPNSITEPRDGATVPGPTVTVAGEGTAFEGTLLYRVTAAGGGVVAEGFTTAGSNGEVGPYTFDVADLAPGAYTVQVWEQGMGESDDDDAPVNLVEVAFTVS